MALARQPHEASYKLQAKIKSIYSPNFHKKWYKYLVDLHYSGNLLISLIAAIKRIKTCRIHEARSKVRPSDL